MQKLVFNSQKWIDSGGDVTTRGQFWEVGTLGPIYKSDDGKDLADVTWPDGTVSIRHFVGMMKEVPMNELDGIIEREARREMAESPGGWLDPPNERHSALECLRARPELTHADVGRRWKCHTCGKVFIAVGTGQQRDPYIWEELGPTGD